MVAQRKQTDAPHNTILQGDALETLRRLPDGCVQTIVTSPPYYGLRDYGVKAQIGLEETPTEYVATLVRLFREAGRVLRRDGTLWVNLGDSYANDTKWGGGTKPTKNAHSVLGGYQGQHVKRSTGFLPKCLMLLPARFAIAMEDDGWICRNEIIWHKTTPVPDPTADRCGRDHETIYLFTKQPHYYFDVDAIRQPVRPKTLTTYGTTRRSKGNDALQRVKADGYSKKRLPKLDEDGNPMGAQLRTVWSFASESFEGAHFATFPVELPRRCILAGSRPGDLVLDPFAGAGTTLMVAQRLGRDYLGIELNSAYIRMAEERMLRDTLPPAMKQTNLAKHIPVRLFDEGM